MKLYRCLNIPAQPKKSHLNLDLRWGKDEPIRAGELKGICVGGWGNKQVKLCRASTPKRRRLSIHHGWIRLSSLPTCLRPKIRVKRRLPSPFRFFSSRGRYLWRSHLLPAIRASRCVFGRWALRSKETHLVTYRL